MLLAVGTGADQTVTLTGSNLTGIEVAGQINAATTGLTASVVDGKIKLAANNASDSLNVKAISNDLYSVLGLLEGVYAAIPGQDSLVISVDGGSGPNLCVNTWNTNSGAGYCGPRRTNRGDRCCDLGLFYNYFPFDRSKLRLFRSSPRQPQRHYWDLTTLFIREQRDRLNLLPDIPPLIRAYGAIQSKFFTLIRFCNLGRCLMSRWFLKNRAS